jgi:hypothetical protein
VLARSATPGTFLRHQQRDRFGRPFTLVMVAGAVNDVATYEARGHVSAEEAFARGTKWTERENRLAGFDVPKGMHYRR